MLGKRWVNSYEGLYCPAIPPSKTHHVFYSIVSRKLPPPLTLEGLCYCQPRLAWGPAGNAIMGHQIILHFTCLINGNSTQTFQFIKSLATMLSVSTVMSIQREVDSDEQEEPTSCFPVPRFQSVCFPAPLSVTEWKKSPGEAEETVGQHVLQTRLRKSTGLGLRSMCAASPINSRAESTAAQLWP